MKKTLVINRQINHCTINIDNDPFFIGDQIEVGRFYTATCQKVGKKGAIFLMDQYLDEKMRMSNNDSTMVDYEQSEVRSYLKGFTLDSMFDTFREYMVPFKNGDLLRIPKCKEMFDDKKRWPLMKLRANRIAFLRDEECYGGWLQDGHPETHDIDYVNFVGTLSKTTPYIKHGIRVVFRLRNGGIRKNRFTAEELLSQPFINVMRKELTLFSNNEPILTIGGEK